MNEQKRAYLYAAPAVLFWSTVASAFKLTLKRVDFITLVFYSSLVSTLLLLIILILRGKIKMLWKPSGSQSGLARSFGRSAIAGFLNPFLYYLVLFSAYSLLPAQEAQPINFTWPVVLSILSAFVLKEKIRIPSFFALLISFFGVLVISTRGDVLGFRVANPPGALLALGSTFIWSAYWLINMKDERDEVLKLFLGFFFGFLYICVVWTVIVWLGVFKGFPDLLSALISRETVSEEPGAFFSRIGLAGFLGCAYIGCFEMGVTFVLWLKALRLTETTARISNLIYLVPFISLVLIHFIVGEQIFSSSITGLVFIMMGVILQSRVK